MALEEAVPSETIDLLTALQGESDGSAYVFLSLDRLEKIDAELTGNGLGANYELMNNLAKRFRTIQREARKRLAEEREVELKEVPWPTGSLHDLRRTYGTHMARVVPIHVLKEYMGHSKIDTTQTFYLAADTRDADVARETLSDFLTPGETEQSRRTSDALPESEPEDADDKNDKALQTQGLSSEADGTRTRNHRIDSLNQGQPAPTPERQKQPSGGQEGGSTGTSREPVEGGFGGGLDALSDAPDRDGAGDSIPAAKAILYCLCTACNAKGFSRAIPQECPRCGATEGFTVSLVVSPIRRTGLNQRGKF